MCGGPEILFAEIFFEEVFTEIVVDAIVDVAIDTVVTDVLISEVAAEVIISEVVADAVVSEIVTDVIVSEVGGIVTDMAIGTMEGALSTGDLFYAAVENGIDSTLLEGMGESIATGLAENGASEAAIEALLPQDSLVEITADGVLDSSGSFLNESAGNAIETVTEVGAEVAPGAESAPWQSQGNLPVEGSNIVDPSLAGDVEGLSQVGTKSNPFVSSETLMSKGGVMSDTGLITMPNGAVYDMVATPMGDAWQLVSGEGIAGAGAAADGFGLNWATIKGVMTSPAGMIGSSMLAKNYMEDQQQKALEQAMAARQSRAAGTTTINTSTSSGGASTGDLAALPVLNDTGDTVAVSGTDSGTDFGLGQIGGAYDPNVRLGRRIASTSGYTNQYFDQRPFGSSINSGNSNNTQQSGWGSAMFNY